MGALTGDSLTGTGGALTGAFLWRAPPTDPRQITEEAELTDNGFQRSLSGASSLSEKDSDP